MLHYVVGNGCMLGVERLVYYVHKAIFHFVVAIDYSRMVVQHYIELFIHHFIIYRQYLIDKIPFSYSAFTKIAHTVPFIYKVHTRYYIGHGVAELFNERRRYTRIYELRSANGCMIDAVLLGKESFYSLVIGQEEGVLPVCIQQAEKVGTLQQGNHVGILLAAVEQKVGHRFTGEGVAVALVNVVVAGKD